MSAPCPIYTTVPSVQVRLTGKVQFQSETGLMQGEIPNALLLQLIADAETAVEQELRSRYAIPFRSAQYGTWDALPDHTRRAIRMVCDLKAVMRILATDFGLGTHVSADPYYKSTSVEYNLEIKRLLGKDMIGAGDNIDRFRVSPPLDDLMLSANTLASADNGVRGRIINTSGGRNEVDYAKSQQNDPSRSYINYYGLGRRR
jgi:hypothetical protein